MPVLSGECPQQLLNLCPVPFIQRGLLGSNAPEPGHDREQWQPEGAAYYNGELVLTRGIAVSEQLFILDNHPIFTGCCPRFGSCYADRDYSAIVHWDCSACGWVDDSI